MRVLHFCWTIIWLPQNGSPKIPLRVGTGKETTRPTIEPAHEGGLFSQSVAALRVSPRGAFKPVCPEGSAAGRASGVISGSMAASLSVHLWRFATRLGGSSRPFPAPQARDANHSWTLCPALWPRFPFGELRRPSVCLGLATSLTGACCCFLLFVNEKPRDV